MILNSEENRSLTDSFYSAPVHKYCFPNSFRSVIQHKGPNTAIEDNNSKMYLQEKATDYFIVSFDTVYQFRFESMKPLKYLTYFAPKSA